ncbi:MAG: prephenate dehydrogenase [Bacteroidota bacterium]
MKVLLVGVGLIGGSFALGLKKRKDLEFGGVDTNQANLEKARELGIISTQFSLESGLAWADLIIISIPVESIKKLLPEILDRIDARQSVIDFGSTKQSICQVAASHPRRKNFIAAHPIAGTENSGPSAALDNLYRGKNLIICNSEESDAEKLQFFEQLAIDAGFYITKMPADEHDRHLAYISHLSHITSYVLSNAVLKKEQDGEVILDLAGSGFESTVRLAKSSPAMWSSIFIENKVQVLNGIAAYQEELSKLRLLIENQDKDGIYNYLEEGRVIRKILD